ncbi:alpha/beta fold hydrolase [Streptomyces sp. XH2]|uniref:alpha/beta fold hydrolase n=1 Tax=Streptomyces sp. XH2 TaxID=3412483 RepID=UPI003C7C7428
MAVRAVEDPAGVGLGAHTDAVAALLDAEGPGVVPVAHRYGVFPALAAADRRPGQVARVVFVDTRFPEPGESVVAQMPQPGLLDRAACGVIPVPEEIPAVHAVPSAELERYHRPAACPRRPATPPPPGAAAHAVPPHASLATQPTAPERLELAGGIVGGSGSRGTPVVTGHKARLRLQGTRRQLPFGRSGFKA